MPNTIPLTVDQRAKRWGTIGAWIGFILICCLVGPLLTTILFGIIGIFASLGALVALWIAYACFAPMLSDLIANWRLKLLKMAAAANPVETLQNEELRRTALLQQKKNQIDSFGGKVRTFDSKLDWYKSKFPAEADKYQKVSDQMHRALEMMGREYRTSRAKLEQYHAVVLKADADWQMAKAVKDATKDMASVQENFMAQLKVDYSLDTIDSEWNTSMAKLDSLMLDAENTNDNPNSAMKALPEGNLSIDFNAKTKTKEIA